MTFTCNENHPAITFTEFHCPLCAEMDEARTLADELDKTQTLLEDIRADVEVHAILDLLTERDEARAHNQTLQKALDSLAHDVIYTRQAPMRGYIAAVTDAAKRAREAGRRVA